MHAIQRWTDRILVHAKRYCMHVHDTSDRSDTTREHESTRRALHDMPRTRCARPRDARLYAYGSGTPGSDNRASAGGTSAATPGGGCGSGDTTGSGRQRRRGRRNGGDEGGDGRRRWSGHRHQPARPARTKSANEGKERELRSIACVQCCKQTARTAALNGRFDSEVQTGSDFAQLKVLEHAGMLAVLSAPKIHCQQQLWRPARKRHDGCNGSGSWASWVRPLNLGTFAKSPSGTSRHAKL